MAVKLALELSVAAGLLWALPAEIKPDQVAAQGLKGTFALVLIYATVYGYSLLCCTLALFWGLAPREWRPRFAAVLTVISMLYLGAGLVLAGPELGWSVAFLGIALAALLALALARMFLATGPTPEP